MERKKRILIADDSEINRELLADILEEEYEIVEAKDGAQAVSILQHNRAQIDMLLLDYVMPGMDGFEVLRLMNRLRWIEDIPVIMISAEQSMAYVDQAYELGVVDFIHRPFEALVVQRRVANTLLLYAKQKKLTDMIIEQIYENERQSNLMINILSHIVEFRNGESGQHVLHIHKLTELMLKRLTAITDRYPLREADIGTIITASALHDVGKISIPAEVINKPGRLTPEEFAIMKTHSMIGARMLQQLPAEYTGEPLVKTAYEICRWHHERYDGRGYPDGLKGDEIPISAQIVALADVYDALTSERVYKKAFSHEVAVEMILDGQCGAFNPLLMQCLRDIAPTLQQELRNTTEDSRMESRIEAISREVMRRSELSFSSHPMRLLERERLKYGFYRSTADELWFEYTRSPSMLTLSPYGARLLGVDEVVVNPGQCGKLRSVIPDGTLQELRVALQDCTREQPLLSRDCKLCIDGRELEVRLLLHALWNEDAEERYAVVIGKLVEHVRETPEEVQVVDSAHDPHTGLLKYPIALQQIRARLQAPSQGHIALALARLENYAVLNASYGDAFGTRLLCEVAERLRRGSRSSDIVSQSGDDCFLLFFAYRGSAPQVGEWILSAVGEFFEDIPLSVRVGMAYTQEGARVDEETLHAAARRALAETSAEQRLNCIPLTKGEAER